MPKITRANQKVFGSSAGAQQIAQFGSFAASSPIYTTDPETIQALAAFVNGWFTAVQGAYSPAIEDMNALCYLFARQLAYIFQAGIGEWDDATTYYIGSLVTDAYGNIYVSLTDDNLNNALTSAANWRHQGGGGSGAPVAINPATQSPRVVTIVDNGVIFDVNSANGAQQFTLPLPSAVPVGFGFKVKDVGGAMGTTYNCTIVRNSSEQIEGYAGTFTCRADYGEWTIYCDGTNWWVY